MWRRFCLQVPKVYTSVAVSCAAAAFGYSQESSCQCEYAKGHAQSFVTYNVLSNHLIHPGFVKRGCAPEHLESSRRLLKIKQKLEESISRGAIIGLQEVSSDWAGEFHTFFAQHNYHVVFAPYGEKFNGRMGSLLAFPMNKFLPDKISLHHVSDSLPDTPNLAMKTPEHLSPHGFLSDVGMAQILGLHRDALNLNYRYAPQGPTLEMLNPRQDREWGLAARRQNVAVLARLRPIQQDGRSFCVGVYHMPCVFGSNEHRQTQNIHALALKSALSNLRATSDEPCILMGDFNIKPGTSGYAVLSGEQLGHEDAPDTAYYRRIYTDLPLTSAYAVHNGSEPGPCQLDYIWISQGCRVLECPKLDPRIRRPSGSEPSDHLMVQAVVQLF